MNKLLVDYVVRGTFQLKMCMDPFYSIPPRDSLTCSIRTMMCQLSSELE